MQVSKSAAHPSWIVTVAIASALLLAILRMGWLISDIRQEKYLTTAIFIAAGALGWVFGMVLSPDSKTEANNFSAVGKSVSLFVSGYLFSKTDGLVTAVLDPRSLLDTTDHLAAYRLIGVVASLLLAAILTYIVRVYALTVGE